MCGIFNVFKSHQKIDKNLFGQSLSLLNHRGPDEQHQYVEDMPHCIAFGHTRLSIIGVDNGKQPLRYKDRLVSIINGEFYDYKSVRMHYQNEGYVFSTETDSEIILPLYLEHGTDCFAKLNGEFAGVIYDKQKEKIIAFRDRHGVKPLFFNQSETGISFSSEIKSILNYEQRKPEFNIRELKDKLFHMPWDQDATIFRGIYNVKPGCFLIYDIKSKTYEQYSYWRVNYDKKNYIDEPLENILEGYKSRVIQAVERRLVADVPVASYLSGGIDSSVCYGIASEIKGQGIDAFTIAFNDKQYDESVLAAKLVKKYSGHQYILEVDDYMLADHFKDHIRCLEGITFNPHGVAKHLLSKLVREKGYKVVITGEGSDEYNCGYITNVIDAMRVNPDKFDIEAIKSKILVNKGVFLSDDAQEIPYIEKLLGSSLSFCSNSTPQLKLVNDLFSSEYQEQYPELKFARYFKKHAIDTQHWDFLNTSLYYQSLSLFSYVLTALGDRTEMAHSVEARVPFLDNDVVDFISKIPPEYKYYKNTDKFILRESCRNFVTEAHYQELKHPYLAPANKKNSVLNTMMFDTFNSYKFRNLGLFDHKKLQALLIENNKETTDPFINRILFQILSVALNNEVFNFSS